MKTAKEWYSECEDPDYSDEFIAWLERIQADAREQGRREGLEEAAKMCDTIRGERHWFESPGEAIEDCADAIRELLAAKPSADDGGERRMFELTAGSDETRPDVTDWLESLDKRKPPPRLRFTIEVLPDDGGKGAG